MEHTPEHDTGASALLAQAHNEQGLKEAAAKRGDSKAALAHAKSRRRALDDAACSAAGREAQRLLRSGGAKAPDFVVKLYCMFTEFPSLIYWDDGRVVVARPEERVEPILAKFFRTGKFSSFQRQLNNFGFHKAPHLSTSKLRIYVREDLEGYPSESVLALRRGQKRGVAPDAARRSDEAVEEWESDESVELPFDQLPHPPPVVHPARPPRVIYPGGRKPKQAFPQWSGEGRCFAI